MKNVICSNIPRKHPNTGATSSTPPTRTTHYAYVLHSQLAQNIGWLRTKRCIHWKQKLVQVYDITNDI